MTPPTWLDAAGRRRPTLACWTCGREVAPMRFQTGDLRPHILTAPHRVHFWLRRIDRWIAYANSVVEE